MDILEQYEQQERELMDFYRPQFQALTQEAIDEALRIERISAQLQASGMIDFDGSPGLGGANWDRAVERYADQHGIPTDVVALFVDYADEQQEQKP